MYVFCFRSIYRHYRMTRFARAKGSKASNERLPNEATPWHLMKQQLEESKIKVPEKKTSAKELLKDERDTCDDNNEPGNWAEFDDNRPNNTKKHGYKTSKSNKNNRDSTKGSENDNANHMISKNYKKSKKLGKIKDAESKMANSEENKLSVERKPSSEEPKERKQMINNLSSNERESGVPQKYKHSNFVMLSKRQKRNLKRKLENATANAKRFQTDVSFRSKTREERIREKGEYKRRKPDSGDVTKLMINGIEIEVVKYDGFPIKKEDADRLTELKQKLIMKGEFEFCRFRVLHRIMLYVLRT